MKRWRQVEKERLRWCCRSSWRDLQSSRQWLHVKKSAAHVSSQLTRRVVLVQTQDGLVENGTANDLKLRTTATLSHPSHIVGQRGVDGRHKCVDNVRVGDVGAAGAKVANAGAAADAFEEERGDLLSPFRVFHKLTGQQTNALSLKLGQPGDGLDRATIGFVVALPVVDGRVALDGAEVTVEPGLGRGDRIAALW